MNVRIHRGANEVGGTSIEVETLGARVKNAKCCTRDDFQPQDD
jgi:hypothetical protein